MPPPERPPEVQESQIVDAASVGAGGLAAAGLVGNVPGVVGYIATVAVLTATSYALGRIFKKRVAPQPQRFAQPVTLRWENNPTAQFPIGSGSRTGGKVVFVYENGSVIHLAIALAEGALPEPIPIGQEIGGRWRWWINGISCLFKRVPHHISGGTPPGRHHYEPITPTTYRGAMRVYWNGSATGDTTTEGQELRELSAGTWTTAHQLTGISWMHLIMDFSRKGIQFPNADYSRTEYPRLDLDADERKVSGVTGMPRLTFEIPIGLSIPDHTGLNPIDGNANTVHIAAFLMREFLGLSVDHLDLPAAAAASALYDSYQRQVNILYSDGTGEATTVRPWAFNGIIDSEDDPHRILQAIENIWNGHIGFEGGKIVFLPGTQTRVHAGSIGPDDLVGEAERLFNNTPATGARTNGLHYTIRSCRQSDYNSTIQLGLRRHTTLVASDGEEIIEELSPASFVNDYYQAQMIAETRTELFAVRLTGTIQVAYTPARALWRINQTVDVRVADAGLTVAKRFVIRSMSKRPNFSIVLGLEEEAPGDPWAIRADYTPFEERALPGATDIYGDPPDTAIASVERVQEVDRTATIYVNLNTVPDPSVIIEIAWRGTGPSDPGLTWASPTLPPTIRASGNTPTVPIYSVWGQTDVVLRARYLTEAGTPLLVSGGDPDGWSADVTSPVDLPRPLRPTGVSITTIGSRHALIQWDGPTFLGYSHTEVAWGTGAAPADDVEGQTAAEVPGLVGFAEVRGQASAVLRAEPASVNWLRIRHINQGDYTLANSRGEYYKIG